MARNNTFSLTAILEKEKLHEFRTNIVEWFPNVSIVLKGANKEYICLGSHSRKTPDEAIDMTHNVY
jgi:hypothetical protein